MTFGERLRAMRERIDVPQDFITRDASLSKAFYSQLENDRSIPSAETLEKLADVFGVTMDELWRGVGKCDPSVMDASGAFKKRRGPKFRTREREVGRD